MLKNTRESFGFITKSLHWLMAIMLIGLFAVGLYMTGLDYYDSLYHTLPWWHKSFGLLVITLLVVRFIWKLLNPKVLPLESHKKWEISLAGLLQNLFYFLILLIGISGYLISTAKGKGIEFFNLFEVKALTTSLDEDRADLIADIHEVLAITLIVLAALHAAAAIKHHVLDKDKTLLRMLNK